MMTNQEYAESLRRLAEFYEKNPNIPRPYMGYDEATNSFMYMDAYEVSTKEELRNVIRALGSCKKEYREDGHFVVTKPFGSLSLRFFMSREQVCERIVVDKVRVIEKRAKTPPPEKVAIEYEEVAVEKEIVEWRCPDTGILEEAGANG